MVDAKLLDETGASVADDCVDVVFAKLPKPVLPKGAAGGKFPEEAVKLLDDVEDAILDSDDHEFGELPVPV